MLCPQERSALAHAHTHGATLHSPTPYFLPPRVMPAQRRSSVSPLHPLGYPHARNSRGRRLESGFERLLDGANKGILLKRRLPHNFAPLSKAGRPELAYQAKLPRRQWSGASPHFCVSTGRRHGCESGAWRGEGQYTVQRSSLAGNGSRWTVDEAGPLPLKDPSDAPPSRQQCRSSDRWSATQLHPC